MSFLNINRSRVMGRVRTSKPRIKYPVIGEVKDADGSDWYVREVRETKHGFDLLFGSPVSRVEPFPTRLPRLIPTQALKDYWEANKTRLDRVVYDLPAGRTTLKRVRHHFGFNVFKDKTKFFTANIDDLRTLTPRQFAAKHKLNDDVVKTARLKVLGRTARELGWWREPRVLNILLSRLTLREMGQKLGIGTTHAARLRERARQEQQKLAA